MDRWPTPLLAAICSGSPEAVLESLSSDPEAAKVKDDDGKTPLAVALGLKDNAAVVVALLEQHPDAAKEEDADGKLPLWLAVKAGAPGSVVAALVSAYPEASRLRPMGQVVLESAHPYEDDVDTYECVEMSGADGLVVTFDPRSRTEKVCDYVRFFKDQSRTGFFGEESYSGREDNNFPGVAGRPPLVIEGFKVIVYFHSDGSSNDWGYKMTIEGTMLLPLHQYLANQTAGGADDEDSFSALAALLDASPSAAEVKRDGGLPLHLVAATARSADVIWLILSANPNAANTREEKWGDLPLHCACKSQKPSGAAIAALLKANPQAAASKNNDGLLPIHALLQNVAGGASAPEEEEIVSAATALLNAYPQAAKDKDAAGKTLLELAGDAAPGSLVALLQSAASQQLTGPTPLNKIPRSLSLASVHPHPLTRAHPKSRWACDVCHKNGGGPGLRACFAWKCSCCDFYVCVLCVAGGLRKLSLLTEPFAGSRHAHELVVVESNNGRICSGLGCSGGCLSGGEVVTGQAWACSKCRDVSFCASCVVYDQGLAGWWPTALLSAIAHALEAAAVAEILERDEAQAKAADDDGTLPLSFAVKCKASAAVVQALLTKHQEAAYAKDITARLALHWAARCQASSTTIEALVAANPAALTDKDLIGSLPLHLSVDAASNEAALALLAAHPEAAHAKDDFGRTPLHYASRVSKQVMEALLAANPAAIRERDVEGRLPIHCAVAAGRPASEALSALLAAYPAGAQATDGAGRTPLELAVICIASASTVALLLKH